MILVKKVEFVFPWKNGVSRSKKKSRVYLPKKDCSVLVVAMIVSLPSPEVAAIVEVEIKLELDCEIPGFPEFPGLFPEFPGFEAVSEIIGSDVVDIFVNIFAVELVEIELSTSLISNIEGSNTWLEDTDIGIELLELGIKTEDWFGSVAPSVVSSCPSSLKDPKTKIKYNLH